MLALTLGLVMLVAGCTTTTEPQTLSEWKSDPIGVDSTEHKVKIPLGTLHVWISEPLKSLAGSDVLSGQGLKADRSREIRLVRWTPKGDPAEPTSTRGLMMQGKLSLRLMSGETEIASSDRIYGSYGFAALVPKGEEFQIEVTFEGVTQTLTSNGDLTVPAAAEILYDPPLAAIENETCHDKHGAQFDDLVCFYTVAHMPWAPGAGWAKKDPWTFISVTTGNILWRNDARFEITDHTTTLDPAPLKSIRESNDGEESYIFPHRSSVVRLNRELTYSRVSGANTAPNQLQDQLQFVVLTKTKVR